MDVELRLVTIDEIEIVWKMQVEAFAKLLEKYQDYDLNPAAEEMDKVLARFEQPETTFYYIIANGDKVGVIRIIDKKDGSRKRISPLWIMKEYRNKGYSKLLNNALLKEAKKLGYNKIYLKTNLDNYYEKYGAVYIDKLNNKEKLYYIDLK